jgi:hypothetical protein
MRQASKLDANHEQKEIHIMCITPFPSLRNGWQSIVPSMLHEGLYQDLQL